MIPDVGTRMITAKKDRSNFSASSLREEDEHLARKLNLTLSDDQLIEEIKVEDIEKKFAQFDFSVKIDKVSAKPGAYIVTFESEDLKLQAHKQAVTIGYNLVKKRRPRPSPKNPVLFWACEKLLISAGKSLYKEVVGEISKDELVLVNSIKSHRARLENINNGKNLGWVWLHTVSGQELLKRVKLKDESFQIENYFVPNEKTVKDTLIFLQRSNLLRCVKKV